MLKSSTSRTLIIAGACLLATIPFLLWGNPSGHDFEFHMLSWMEILSQWHHGTVYPNWAAMAHWGYGEPRFVFYPPASWTLGAVLGAMLPWKIVPAIYCWIVLTLAGTAMYRVARECLTRSDALFAAIFYALNPYHLLNVYWRSAYAELLGAAVLPCVLLCLLRLKTNGIRATLWLSLALAAAWLTNAPAALIIHYVTAGLALVGTGIALAGRRECRADISRPLLRVALAIFLGACLASFYLLPAIYEQRWINLGEVLSPGVRPQDNFLFTALADPDHNRFNLLVSTVAVSELIVLLTAIWFARQRREGLETPAAAGSPTIHSAVSGRRIWMLLCALGIGSAFLLFRASNLLWQYLPKLQFVQLPFRWLIGTNAALALLLAMATRRWAPRLLVCGALLTTLVIAGNRIQPPWWELAADIREMRDSIIQGTGYEGTDEYVPAGVDAYNVDKKLPIVSSDEGAPVVADVVVWRETEKHFKVHSSAPANLTVRLFNYPAWQVTVNGKPTTTRTSDDVGLIVIPVASGNSDVQIRFGRTADRVAGNMISLISLFVFVFLLVWTKPASPNRFSADASRLKVEGTASPAV